jgi:hypothetical protein
MLREPKRTNLRPYRTEQFGSGFEYEGRLPMALKQIEKDQVRAGMWIHAIKGVWFFHPFWRGKFLLEHSDDVDALRSARISGVIIDTDKGSTSRSTLPRPRTSPLLRPPPHRAPACAARATSRKSAKPRLAPIAPAARRSRPRPKPAPWQPNSAGRARP